MSESRMVPVFWTAAMEPAESPLFLLPVLAVVSIAMLLFARRSEVA